MIPSDQAKQLIRDHGLDMAIAIVKKSIKENINNRQNHWFWCSVLEILKK